MAIPFSEPAVLFSNAGETPSLPTFVYRLGDPVDSRVAANLQTLSTPHETEEPSSTHGLVTGVNEDDLVVFVYTILVNPVRVQYPQVTTAPPDTFFCYTP